MTGNSLRAEANKVAKQEAEIKNRGVNVQDRAQRETERYNKKREKAQNFRDYVGGAKDIASGVSGLVGAGGGLAGTIGKLISANDPAWYTTDKQLTKDVGALSFGRPAGINLEYSGLTTVPPAIAVYRFVPTIGDPNIIDVTAKNVYAFVRYKNSGSTNYDAPDLMQYILAMDTLYYMWAEGRRLYAALRYVNTMNRNSQAVLIQALGFGYNDCLQHINDLRVFLNQLKLRLSSFYLPKSIAYYQRHMWLAANVFADDKLQKAQWHAFIPGCYYHYIESAGRLEPVRRAESYTFSAWVTEVNLAMNLIVSSESIGIMSGDILKAYGDGSTVQLSDITEDVTLDVIYSDEVLEQINNATVFPDTFRGDDRLYGFWIGQNSDGKVIQGYVTNNTDPFMTEQPTVSYSVAAAGTYRVTYSGPILLVSKEDQPTPDRVFTMTRLCALASRSLKVVAPNTVTMYQITVCGSEVILGGFIFSPDGTGGADLVEFYDGMKTASVTNLGPLVQAISYFDAFPMLRFANNDVSGSEPTVYSTHFIGENIISEYRTTFEKLHTTALMSLFGLPYTESLNKPSLR